MAKKRVYFETAAISYLTADKPTLDIVQLARRQLTRQWWEHRNRRWKMIDDDPDPIEEIRTTRRKIMQRCKTVEGYYQHLSNLPPAEEMAAQFNERLAKAQSHVEKQPVKRPVSHRRRTLVHA